MLLDSGSQRSYVIEKTARELCMTPKGKVQLCHLLFGGLKQTKDHQSYDLEIDVINIRLYAFKFWDIGRSVNVYDYMLKFGCPN